MNHVQPPLFADIAFFENTAPRPRSQEQKNKVAINYRKSETGESCKTCKYTTYGRAVKLDNGMTICESYRNRKCPFIGFSKGQATDIKKNHICDKYEYRKIEDTNG